MYNKCIHKYTYLCIRIHRKRRQSACIIHTQYYYYIIASSVYVHVYISSCMYRYARGVREVNGGDGGNYSGCFCDAAVGLLIFILLLLLLLLLHVSIICTPYTYFNSRAQQLRRFHMMIIIILYV